MIAAQVVVADHPRQAAVLRHNVTFLSNPMWSDREIDVGVHAHLSIRDEAKIQLAHR